jgi:GTPase Era involved in 16S rRNA processing
VRAILVGTSGSVIGEVGIRARQAATRALGCQVQSCPDAHVY